jgi:hypothetical protein
LICMFGSWVLIKCPSAWNPAHDANVAGKEVRQVGKEQSAK